MVIYFGIGTNLGEREANLRKALELLHERVGECLACSSIYRSAPQGFVSENQFANIVAVCQTDHSPIEILHITQQIERDMGRTEKSVNGIYHDRVIDIDLLMAYRGDEQARHSPTRSCSSSRACRKFASRSPKLVPIPKYIIMFSYGTATNSYSICLPILTSI